MSRQKRDTQGPSSRRSASVKVRQNRLLEAYRDGFPTARAAAKKARVHRATHHRWLRSDPAYAEAFRALEAERVEELEAEAYRRAVVGLAVPKTVAGKRVDVREYSDALLMFLLKAEAPQKYRDRSHLEVEAGDSIRDLVLAADAVYREQLGQKGDGDT